MTVDLLQPMLGSPGAGYWHELQQVCKRQGGLRWPLSHKALTNNNNNNNNNDNKKNWWLSPSPWLRTPP